MTEAMKERAAGVPVENLLRPFGAIPWRKGRHGGMRVLLVTSRGRGCWIVPKGRPAKEGPPMFRWQWRPSRRPV